MLRGHQSPSTDLAQRLAPQATVSPLAPAPVSEPVAVATDAGVKAPTHVAPERMFDPRASVDFVLDPLGGSGASGLVLADMCRAVHDPNAAPATTTTP